MTEPLRGRHEVAFTYRRSLGEAGRVFASGLKEGRIWGSVGADGAVTVPPVEWDAATGERSLGYVPVADTGTVMTWTQAEGRTLALALIRLDGAVTSLLHFVDAESVSGSLTGLRVQAEWNAERSGALSDIRCFVAVPDAAPAEGSSAAYVSGEGRPEAVAISDTHLTYGFEPGLAMSEFLRRLVGGEIAGGRCSQCHGVYVPPRPQCPACLAGPLMTTPVSDHGTVTAFTVVHIPFHGMDIELPFVTAWVRLDGASVPFAHLLRQVEPDGISVGMRVEAVWAPPGEREPSWECIRWFRPETAA